jgi:hypothetical protein
MKTRVVIQTFLLISFTLSITIAETVKRGRNEGTANISASNVESNGNILISAGMLGDYGGTGFRVDPGASLTAGIADIMQLSGRASMENFVNLGLVDMHLQLTTPGNDHLRFFGFGITGDLFLSAKMDTVSLDVNADKPNYHSYIRGSMVCDLDWIAINKQLPLKTYWSFGMADNPDLLYLYDQISIKSGIEWKMYDNSLFTDIGYGLYKEKKHQDFSGDKRYLQKTLWIEPGARYRLFGKFSLLSSLRVVLLQKVKQRNPLSPDYIRLSTSFVIPLIYRETNTEAIRTLVFLEQQKERKKDIVAKNIEEGKKLKTDFEMSLEQIDKSSNDNPEDEKSLMKRREEIQLKMDEIETLLEELDNENK